MQMEKGARPWLPLLAIVLAVGGLSAFAVHLNRLYYAAHGPFYDSMAYMNHLAKVMAAARDGGFVSAVAAGARGTTVFVPWLEGAVLGLFADPAREHAVLIQLPLVLALVAAAYLFFRKVAGYGRPVSVAFAVAMIAFQAIFGYNGGLSDLRMDLSQALAFGASLAFLAIARTTQQRRYWVLFGLMLGVSFLFRATTPVYAVLLFGSVALLDAVRDRSAIRERLGAWLLAAAVAVVVSIWFFVLNFQDLYYYYFVWNYDANAKLPIAQSRQHLEFLFGMHLGTAMCLLMGAVLAGQVVLRILARQPLLKDVNWFMLAAGVVPVGFLVLFGAALNPFVSMVSAPGFMFFALAPYVGRAGVAPPPARVELAYAAAAVLAIVFTARTGIGSHTEIASPWAPSMPGLQEVTRAMDTDLAARRLRSAKFEVTFVGSLDSMAILNSLVFDRAFRLDLAGVATKSGLSLTAIQPGLANPVDWAAIPGASAQEKLGKLVSEAIASADYLVMPDDGTSFIPHHPISPHAFTFRDMILAHPGLTRIAGPIRMSKLETVSVYRNAAAAK